MDQEYPLWNLTPETLMAGMVEQPIESWVVSNVVWLYMYNMNRAIINKDYDAFNLTHPLFVQVLSKAYPSDITNPGINV